MATLSIDKLEDVLDLADWLETHAGESGVPEGMLEAADFLNKLEGHETEVVIPPELVPALQWAIDDWCELLAAHDENFETQIKGVP